MKVRSSRAMSRHACGAALGLLLSLTASAQAPAHYQPTIASLNRHPLPQWYDDAKLGIFIHWGLYSVPGWAPLTQVHLGQNQWKDNPYAEW